MPSTLSILSTKTLGEEARELAQALGWTLREEDFIHTRAIPQAGYIVPSAALVIFTSVAGLEHLPGPDIPTGALALWSVACLSGQTKTEAQKIFGETQLLYTAPNAKELAQAIADDGRFREAVFFCAKEHRPELPEILREKGIQLTEVPVYETTNQPKAIDSPYDGVLFFSPSGVSSFFQQNQPPKGTIFFAIGNTTAASIKDYTNERIIISHAPTQDAMLRSVQFYYDNQQR